MRRKSLILNQTASANCGKGVVVQGDANANGAAPDIGGRK